MHIQLETVVPDPYVVVLSNNQFFTLDVLSRGGKLLTIRELQHQLDKILETSKLNKGDDTVSSFYQLFKIKYVMLM